MKKISVIIPIYNVEKYVEECLESVLSSKLDDIEIICVDDASNDGSLYKIEQLSAKDSRIKIIRHEKNMGLSEARNTGLKYATGKYVLFVDSDDFISSDALSILFREAENKKVDIVYFDHALFYDSSLASSTLPKTRCKDYEGIFSGKEFFCMTMKEGDYTCVVWGQLFRRIFLQENNLTFLPGILHEDQLFSFYAAMKADRVCALKKTLYFYRQREGSIMQTKNCKRAQSMFVILCEIYVYWKTNSFTERESFYIEQLWKSIYQAYALYKTYGNESQELQCGDRIDQVVYRALNGGYEKKWIDFDGISIDKIKQYKHVFVYGAGQAAKQVVDYLHRNKIQVKRILVEDKKVNPESFCGLRVHEVTENVIEKSNTIVIVGVTSKHSQGIKENLIKNGFSDVIELKDANEM